MATGNLIKNFSDEATCSICLEYFKDPVTVGCGHNFCQACITQSWKKAQAAPSCPQCRETISQRNFRPNHQLRNLVGLIKKLQLEKQEEEERGVCGKHKEPLKLFCKEDRMCICVVCHLSDAHKDHKMFPLVEASEEYKEEIRNHIISLMKMRKELESLRSVEGWKSQDCLALLEKEKQKVMSAFKQLQKALEENKQAWQYWLDNLGMKMKKHKEENAAELLKKITNLNSLVAEMNKKCKQPADKFLQGIGHVLDRCDSAKDKKLLLKPASELDPILQMCTQRRKALEIAVENCKDSLEKSLLKANVTLDTNTAHPCLSLSANGTEVTEKSYNRVFSTRPEQFDTVKCVLGQEKFIDGRHYWDVEIKGNRGTWVIGVARESVKRKGDVTFSPEEGIWAIRSTPFLPSGSCYSSGVRLSALTSPSETFLSPSQLPSKVRVSLDCEAGCVAFSDACRGVSLFTFSSASFAGERVCPFFQVSERITLKCC